MKAFVLSLLRLGTFFSCLVIGAFFIGINSASAATRTWDGGGADGTCGGVSGDGNKWSCALNWSDDTVPLAADSVLFDDSQSSKNAVIDQAFTVVVLEIDGNFNGTVTQSADLTITQDFDHTGGGAGLFTHASGTLIFSGGTEGFWHAYVDDTFGNVTIDKDDLVALVEGDQDSLTVDAPQVNGTLTLTDGRVTPANGDTDPINAYGNIVVGSDFDGGGAYVYLADHALAQTYTLNGGVGLSMTLDNLGHAVDEIIFTAAATIPVLTITNNFDGVIPVSNPNDVEITILNWDQEVGTYDASAQSSWRTESLIISGGTFIASDTITLFGALGGTLGLGGDVTFNNVVIDSAGALGVLGTLVIDGDLTFTDGGLLDLGFFFLAIESVIEVQGDVVVTSGFDGGWLGSQGVPIAFVGSATQTLTLTGATDLLNSDIRINKTGGQVNLASNLVMDYDDASVGVQALAITEGKLNLAGYNLTVNGLNSTFVVEDGGNFQLQGGETLTLDSGMPTLSTGSTVTYTGNDNSGANTYVITDLANTYSNLVINSADGATDIFELGGVLQIDNDFTITAGTVDVVVSQNYPISVAGDWSNSGTFTARLGAVTLNGTDQSLSGTTTFRTLTKSVASSATLTLPAGVTQTITGTLTLTGASGALLALESSAPGVQAELDAQGGRSLRYLDVLDNNNINATTMSCTAGCIDNDNNENWTFIASSSGGGFIRPTYAIEYQSPQAGQVLRAGEQATIIWETSSSGGAYVNGEISYDDGETFATLFTLVPNEGVYAWVVPDVSSTEVVIRIASTNGGVELASDTSTPFTIVGSSDGGDDEETLEPEEVEPRTYIRGLTLPTVYYIDSELKRHPIFNEQMYFTYEDSWDAVQFVEDSSLAAFPMATSVLPKAGVVLVKIMSVNNVYAVTLVDDVTVLRHITSEALAADIYGSGWSDYVIDVEPTFWSKFSFGAEIKTAISVDRSLLKKRWELVSE